MDYSRADYERAAAVIRAQIANQPEIALVLGSGLGGLADMIENPTTIPYQDIPGWTASTVPGHSGRLVIGTLEGKTILTQQGRAHFYEGYSMQQVTFPVRVMHFLGIKTLILTNAAGGIDRTYKAGDLMLMNDHINFPGMAGHHPLTGHNDDSLGPRFPGMAQTYDKLLRRLAHQVAKEENIRLHEGVYAALAGPTFETPAEIRFLRAAGANAVGMSTVHEVIVARHTGMRVMAFSSITNVTIDEVDTTFETNHEEVLEVGKLIVPRLTALLKGVLKAMPS